jgi:hypothetical protein
MIRYISIAISIGSWLLLGASSSRAQTSNQTSNVGANSSGNTVQQSNPQNNQQITFPNIYPLNPVIQNPINTENDLGINLGAGVNTLDSRNVTVYLGVTFQPGRTDDHNARMAKLKSETQLLEAQKQSTQTQLELLKQQVIEQELRLQRMRGGQVVPK